MLKALRALLALAAIPAGATQIWAISGDPNNFFVPDQLSLVDSSAQTVLPVATLGDGSIGFNGGMTVGPGGALYGIGNDSSGAGSLYIIHPDGSITLVGTAGGLGFGFLGGLAWDSANSAFYAAVNDSLGNSSLYSVDAGGNANSLGLSIGTGFSGLTYNSATDMLTGFENDSGGNSSICTFNIAVNNESCSSFGNGFGGITYDAPNDLLYFIGSVNNSNSTLWAGSSSVFPHSIFTLGNGFGELAATASAAPEPVTTGVCAATLLAIFGWTRRKK